MKISNFFCLIDEKCELFFNILKQPCGVIQMLLSVGNFDRWFMSQKSLIQMNISSNK